eukprot:PhM_4_TR18754/c0_g1_i1/m.17181/K05290/PIGK; phosphatidylinositol glycan, class K
MISRYIILLLLFAVFHLPFCCYAEEATSSHSNWAVIVSTSRFWFNYRHGVNALTYYRTCKRWGIPDSNIILMLADDIPCNARHPMPGRMLNADGGVDLYGDDVEVDFRGYDVTVSNILRVLQDRWPDEASPKQRLRSDSHSNVFLFLTGHGGNGYLKVQDAEQITTQDLAESIAQMHARGRYRNMFVVVDTCEAESLCDIPSPNVVCFGSSKVGQNSLSHGFSRTMGQSPMDGAARAALDFITLKLGDPIGRGRHHRTSVATNASVVTLDALYRSLTPAKVRSDVTVTTTYRKEETSLKDLRLLDYLGSSTGSSELRSVEIVEDVDDDDDEDVDSVSENYGATPRNLGYRDVAV